MSAQQSARTVVGGIRGALLIGGVLAGAWSRVGHIVLGLIFLIAGIVAFSNFGLAAGTLATFVGALVGILWIVEGVVSLTTLGGTRSRGWTIAFAVLSIVAGVLILFAPVWGALVLWVWLGISLILLGAIQIVRASRLRAR